MTIQMLKGKIHRAVVVQAELNYVGSITVDPELMDAAGICEYEKVNHRLFLWMKKITSSGLPVMKNMVSSQIDHSQRGSKIIC